MARESWVETISPKKEQKKEFKVGDAVEWIHVSGRRNYHSITRVAGFIHEIKDGKYRCRRGKNGKVDHWLTLDQIGPSGCDPLRNLVSALAGAHRGSSGAWEMKVRLALSRKRKK